MVFLIGIPLILITVLGIQLMFIFKCDYIDFKILLILLLLHMAGNAFSILSSNNNSLLLKCLVFLVTIVIIFSSSIVTRNYCKKTKNKKILILSGFYKFQQISNNLLRNLHFNF